MHIGIVYFPRLALSQMLTFPTYSEQDFGARNDGYVNASAVDQGVAAVYVGAYLRVWLQLCEQDSNERAVWAKLIRQLI